MNMILPVKRCSSYLCICFICLSLLAGCASKKTRSGGIMPYYNQPVSENFTSQGIVTGKSSSFSFLWLIPVTPPLDLDAAVKNAMGSRGADNLHEITWWYETQYWIVGTVNIVEVRGEAVVYRQE